MSLYNKKLRASITEAFKKETRHYEKCLVTFQNEYFDGHEPTTEQMRELLSKQPMNGLYYLFFEQEYKNNLWFDMVTNMVLKIDASFDLWIKQLYKDIIAIGKETGTDVSKVQQDMNSIKSELVPNVQKILDFIEASMKRREDNEGDMIA